MKCIAKYLVRGEYEINENKKCPIVPPTGDKLIQILESLANPHRLKIISILAGRRIHVSQLAREMMISRPLLYMHLKRLEDAGLVTSKMELSEDGKAMNYYEVVPFALNLSPEVVREAVKTLTVNKSNSAKSKKEVN